MKERPKENNYALIIGCLYLLMGVLGFIPNLVTPPAADYALRVPQGYGDLFGVFPVNILHNLIHIAVGLWGLASYRDYAKARNYAQSMAVLYAVIALMGLIPDANTMFGTVPIYGNNVWLNALVSIIGAYVGFTSPEANRNAGHNDSMRRSTI